MWTTIKNNLLGKKFLGCSFYLCRFRKHVSYSFPIIHFCNPRVHYETPCIIRGPPSYMRPVVDRNVVMRRIPVKVTLSLNLTASHSRHYSWPSTNQSLHHTGASGAASHPGCSISEKRAGRRMDSRGIQDASKHRGRGGGTLLGLLRRSQLQPSVNPPPPPPQKKRRTRRPPV